MSRRRAPSIKSEHANKVGLNRFLNPSLNHCSPLSLASSAKKSLDSFQLAAWIARAADEKLAQHIEILAFDDADGKTVPAGFFVMCTAESATHLRAISHGIATLLSDWWHITPDNRDVDTDGRWHILDYGPVMVHIMRSTDHAFYDLESLWEDRISPVPSLVWDGLIPPERHPQADHFKWAS